MKSVGKTSLESVPPTCQTKPRTKVLPCLKPHWVLSVLACLQRFSFSCFVVVLGHRELLGQSFQDEFSDLLLLQMLQAAIEASKDKNKACPVKPTLVNTVSSFFLFSGGCCGLGYLAYVRTLRCRELPWMSIGERFTFRSSFWCHGNVVVSAQPVVQNWKREFQHFSRVWMSQLLTCGVDAERLFCRMWNFCGASSIDQELSMGKHVCGVCTLPPVMSRLEARVLNKERRKLRCRSCWTTGAKCLQFRSPICHNLSWWPH